jgi:hypothetical protein
VTGFEGGAESPTNEPDEDDDDDDDAAAAASLDFRATSSDSPSFFGEVPFFVVAFLFVVLFLDFLILSDAAAAAAFLGLTVEEEVEVEVVIGSLSSSRLVSTLEEDSTTFL